MKKLIFLMLLASTFCAKAQEFKEGLIFDLRGPVKEVLLDNDTFGIRGMAFTRDGKCNPSVMKFDSNGYPLGMTLAGGSDIKNNDNASYQMSYVVNYDDSQRIASTVMDNQTGLYAGKETRSFSYGVTPDEMNVVKEMTVDSAGKDGTSRTEYSYSDYRYDSHGNWISREVVRTISWEDSPGKSDTSRFVETRTVTYYD